MRQPVLALVIALLAVASAVAVTLNTPPLGTNTGTSAPAGLAPPLGPSPAPAPKNLPVQPLPSPPRPRATLAEPLTGAPYWVQRDIENQIALFVGAPSDVLFLGDSITDFLERGDGKFFWDWFYAPLGALDFGIAATRTSHVLWQIESGQVKLAAPKVVVLMIGTNNLWAGEAPADVAAGVERIVSALGEQLPDTRILLLGILPCGKAKHPIRPLIIETNRRLADLAGDRVTYMDIGAWFLDPDGEVSPVLMPDGIHPSHWGYFVYSVAIWDQLMGLLYQSNSEP